MKVLGPYLATLVFFLAVDMVFLGVIAKDFYRASIGHLMADGFNIPAAFVFYAIYIAGVMIFVINPAIKAGDWSQAALYGALFGFFCYATYDLTNLATLKDWPLVMSLADMAWGATITAAASVVGYAVGSRF
ncbi:MAG: DUF2177 family protein [Hyphomicrobium sp.]